MNKPSKDQDEITEEETARRRDAVLKRMLKTLPKPHKAAQSGKKRGGDRRQSKKSS